MRIRIPAAVFLLLVLPFAVQATFVKTLPVTLEAYGFVLNEDSDFVVQSFQSEAFQSPAFPAEWGELLQTDIHYESASAQLAGSANAAFGEDIGLYTVGSEVGLFASYNNEPFQLLQSASMSLSGAADPIGNVSGTMDTSVFDGVDVQLPDGGSFSSNDMDSIRHQFRLQLTAMDDLDAQDISADAVMPASITFWLVYHFNESAAYIDAGSPEFVPAVPEPGTYALGLGLVAMLFVLRRRT